jgi:cytochrome c biogenesis protein CcdA
MMDINKIMKKKIKYIVFFIAGILIAEIPLIDVIEYIMLSIVQTYFKYFFDIMVFVLGFMISFNALKNLDEIKDKKRVL